MKHWPKNTDVAFTQWKKYPNKVHMKMDGYAKFDDKIPLSAWIGGAIVLALIFGFVPLLYVFMGK